MECAEYDALLGGYVVKLTREQLEGSPSYATNERGVWDNGVWPERVRGNYEPLI